MIIYGIIITKDDKVISLLEECGFDIICTNDRSFAGIITMGDEFPWIDQELWDACNEFLQKKYGEILEGADYFRIREEDIIC